MAAEQNGLVTSDVRTLFGEGAIGGLSDRQLLERFGRQRGETREVAFTALVRRHGPLVLRVCRGLLRESSDIEDAFQATFMVLSRQRPGTLWVRDSLGPWLHAVACRVCARARVAAAKRRRHERCAAERIEMVSRPQPADVDLAPLVHEEVGRLPDRYRVPLVLCYFEGLTHEQAARELGWPVGTVRSRLARGRDRLRGQLERRGAAPASGMLGAGLAADRAMVISSVLLERTVRAVGLAPSATVARLSGPALQAILMSRWVPLMVLIVAAASAGLILASQPGGGSDTVVPVAGAVPGAGLDPALRLATAVPRRTEAEQLADRLLKKGSGLFNAKQARALAATYTDDGEIHLVERSEQKSTRGRAEVERFYTECFAKAGTIDSENFVDFARFVAPDVLLIDGHFRPNAGERTVPFVQMRVKQGADWRLHKLWLFTLSTRND